MTLEIENGEDISSQFVVLQSFFEIKQVEFAFVSALVEQWSVEFGIQSEDPALINTTVAEVIETSTVKKVYILFNCRPLPFRKS